MKDPHDNVTFDAFDNSNACIGMGLAAAKAAVKRGRGRPAFRSAEEKKEQAAKRQERFRLRKAAKEKAMKRALEMLNDIAQGKSRSNKQTLLEFIQFINGIGESLGCVVETHEGRTIETHFDSLIEIIVSDLSIYRIY